MAQRDEDDGKGGRRGDGREEGPSLFDLPLESPRRRRPQRRPDAEEGASGEVEPAASAPGGAPPERPAGDEEPPAPPSRRGRRELPLFPGEGGEEGRRDEGRKRPSDDRDDDDAPPEPEPGPEELPLAPQERGRRRGAPGTGRDPSPDGVREPGEGPADEPPRDLAPGRNAPPPDEPAPDRLELDADAAPGPPVEPAAPRRPRPAPLGHRLGAGLLDGGLLLVASAAAIVGSFLLDVRWDGEDLPALGLFLLVFSFAYSVVPLAFWGRTPGMALTGIVSRGADGGPLTFGQTAVRWLAGLFTVALAGLPLLLALRPLGSRSLADRLSGSHTWLPPG